MTGALPLCIRIKGPCVFGPMVNVYPDQKVNVYPHQKVHVNPDQKGYAYTDQRSMRLPSPAQRAGFRVGIIAPRANGPAIWSIMQTSGPLALGDSMGGR